MTERIKKLREKVLNAPDVVCIQKYLISMQSMDESREMQTILRRGKLQYDLLTKIPIFVEPEDFFVGYGASRPNGYEIEMDSGRWDKDEIDALRAEGYIFAEEDEEILYRMNEQNRPVSSADYTSNVMRIHPRIKAFMESGMNLPPWRFDTGAGKQVGGGLARSGLGLSPGMQLYSPDYEMLLKRGIRSLIEECDAELDAVDFVQPDGYQRSLHLQSMRMALQGLLEYAARYVVLLEELAEKEEDASRKQELLAMAEVCRRVPAEPARTFREAFQMFWFIFLVITPGATASMGRFDQYMYPYYAADIEASRITDEEVLEYLEALRLRDMQIAGVGGKQTRKRHAGHAKWHNMVICGVKPDGSDATNRLSYLLLEALERCPTPHHTLTMRVADSTPDEIMLKGIDCQRKGLSMPAFVGDKSYISFFVNGGLAVEDARNYCMAGCVDAEIPGKTISTTCPMFVLPMALEVFLNGGVDPKNGNVMREVSRDLNDYQTYEQFYEAFKDELSYFIHVCAERCNIDILATRELFPEPLRSATMQGGIRDALDFQSRRLWFDNGQLMNPVGMVNLGNCLRAIKTVVYDEKRVTLAELKQILDANWEGHEDLRRYCKSLEFYGNGNDEADAFVGDLYRFWVDTVESIPAVLGGHFRSTAISITSHQPGGELTGATPDGRYKGKILADACASPMAGDDHNGPLKVLTSAMKIPQERFQAMLLNMKFHPSALKTTEDMKKLMAAIRVYFANDGKHIQFVVCDQETLIEAQKNPEEHRDLTVRVAGYSAYFVQLNNNMQNEIISRTSNETI